MEVFDHQFVELYYADVSEVVVGLLFLYNLCKFSNKALVEYPMGNE